jgi:predicted SAM-dependent methyltransferase
MSQKLGLNLGCGRDVRPTTASIRWINVDYDADVHPDIVGSVEFPFPGVEFGTVDEIEANDILEHVPYRESALTRWHDALKLWIKYLAPGGRIRIQVPDIHAIIDRYCARDIDFRTLNRVLFGESTNTLDHHYQVFDMDELAYVLELLGLEILEKRRLHVCAIIIARRPA